MATRIRISVAEVYTEIGYTNKYGRCFMGIYRYKEDIDGERRVFVDASSVIKHIGHCVQCVYMMLRE